MSVEPVRFHAGDHVRVRRAHPPGHVRTPWYMRRGGWSPPVRDLSQSEELAYARPGGRVVRCIGCASHSRRSGPTTRAAHRYRRHRDLPALAEPVRRGGGEPPGPATWGRERQHGTRTPRSPARAPASHATDLHDRPSTIRRWCGGARCSSRRALTADEVRRQVDTWTAVPRHGRCGGCASRATPHSPAPRSATAMLQSRSAWIAARTAGGGREYGRRTTSSYAVLMLPALAGLAAGLVQEPQLSQPMVRNHARPD